MTYFSIHQEFEYYQGFHDIVAVLSLPNFKDEEVLYYIDKLTKVYFDKYLTNHKFSDLLLSEIELLVEILSKQNSEIDPDHLRLCCMSEIISKSKYLVAYMVYTRDDEPPTFRFNTDHMGVSAQEPPHKY